MRKVCEMPEGSPTSPPPPTGEQVAWMAHELAMVRAELRETNTEMRRLKAELQRLNADGDEPAHRPRNPFRDAYAL